MLDLAVCAPAGAAGPLPEGRKTISLAADDGARQVIGAVTFTPCGDDAAIDVTIEAPKFKD